MAVEAVISFRRSLAERTANSWEATTIPIGCIGDREMHNRKFKSKFAPSFQLLHRIEVVTTPGGSKSLEPFDPDRRSPRIFARLKLREGGIAEIPQAGGQISGV
jgi:hypothetical protein